MMEDKVGIEEIRKNKRKKRRQSHQLEVMVEDGDQLMEDKAGDGNTDKKKSKRKSRSHMSSSW